MVELSDTPLFITLRASLAVPGMFAPVHINKRLVVDGGLVRNLPIDMARKMGADIEITDPHRALIFGKTPLLGTHVDSADIRGGATLILAGLVARGQTTITGVNQIDRGYEKIEEKLNALGARIERVIEN